MRNKGFPWAILVAVVFTFFIPVLVSDPYWIHLFITVLLNLICVIGLWLITSTGQLSIGQGGFMAVGAYTSALLTKMAFPFWPAFLFAGLAAGLVALLIGLPTLKIKGAYFSILTFAFGEVIRLILYSIPGLGGSDGITGIPQSAVIPLPGFQVKIASQEGFYFFTLVLMWLSFVIAYRLQKTYFGRNFRAIADSDNLAESLGINSMNYKVLAFIVGAIFAGLAGSVMAHYLTFVGPDFFSFSTSVNFLLYVLIGGTGTIAGPMVGATFLTIIAEVLAAMKEYQLIIFGILLMVVSIYLPGGLISLPGRIAALRKRPEESE